MARACPFRRRQPAALLPAVAEPPPSAPPTAAPRPMPLVRLAWPTRADHLAERAVVLVLTLLALGLRLYDLGRQSLWLDEGLSVYFARLPLAELLPTVVERDIHPPLHVLLLHLWLPVAGSGEFAARWPSAAAGTLLVPVVWAMARALFIPATAKRPGAGNLGGAGAAVLAAALTAVSPFLLYFSQEARNYALLALFATLATYCLWRALDPAASAVGPNGAIVVPTGRRGWAAGPGWWPGYAVAAALTLYTHYYGALILLFHGGYVLLARRGWRGFALAAASVVLLYAPWLAGLTSQLYRLWRQPDFWAGTIDAWTVVGRTFSAFTLGHQDRWSELLPVVAALGVAFVAGGVLAWRGAARGSGAGLFLALYLIVPAGALYAVTANNPKFAERYLIAVAPPVTLLLARALAAPADWRPRFARWLGPALAALLGLGALGASAFAAAAVYTDPLYAKDDHRGAVAAIEREAQAGDVTLLLLDTYPTYTYYSHGAVPYAGLDGARDLDVVAADLNRITAGHARLWTLLWQAQWADPNGLLLGVLQDQAAEAPVAGAFKGLTLRRFEVPAGGFSALPPHRFSAGFEGRAEFVGFGTPNPGAAAGDTLRLGFYWRSLVPVTEDLRVTATLRDAAGNAWGSVTAPPAGFHLATTEWEPPALYRGQFDLPVDPGTPPGEYSVEIDLYDPATRQEWRILDGAGAPVGTRLKLPLPFAVFRPEPPLPPAAYAADTPLTGRLGPANGGIEAVGARFEVGRRAGQGDELPVAIHWRAVGAAGRPATGLRLAVAGNGPAQPRVLWQGDPVPGYPSSTWATGDILTGQYRLPFPVELAPGRYRLLALPAGAAAASDGIDLGEVEVAPLPRQFEAPAVPRPQTATLGGAATLLGYDLAVGDRPAVDGSIVATPADAVRLTLFWRVDGTLTGRYKVFAHLTDATGAVQAQTDLVPVEGTRPTPSWLPGEYLVDPRDIALRDLKPGRYAVRIGLYDEATGERLPVTAGTGQGADFVVLDGASVEVR